MKKLSINQWIVIIISIIVVGWFFMGSGISMFSFYQDNSSVNTESNNMQNQQAGSSGPAVSSAPGLTFIDEIDGGGAEAVAGKLITAHYTGALADGTVFDTSIGRDPFSFPLGQGLVIQGWDQGIVGMKVGGTRRLIISPELGYGAIDMKDRTGKVIIPANSTLVFEVQLLDVK